MTNEDVHIEIFVGLSQKLLKGKLEKNANSINEYEIS